MLSRPSRFQMPEMLEPRLLFTGGSSSGPSPTSVPTIYSPQWVAEWQQALAAGNPWAQLVLNNAQLTGTPGQVYNDIGQWAVFAYLMTGNTSYVDNAWSFISSELVPMTDPNGLRDYVTAFDLMYYGLEQGGYWNLHPDYQQEFINSMNTWCQNVFTYTDVSVRLTDSDQCVGALGVLLWGLMSQGVNPEASQWINNPIIGGLVPTADNMTSTVRNAVYDYCQEAAGGQWIESSDYNMNTVQLLMQATEGIRAVTGVDYFPEATALYQQIAVSQMAMFTPDLAQTFQWGDEEWPRNLKLFDRETDLGELAGLTQDDPAVGPYIQQFVIDIANQYGWTGGLNTAQPEYQLFFFFNPEAPTADWQTLPEFDAPPDGVAVQNNPGEGFTFFREGLAASSAAGELLSYNPSGVDHQYPAMSNFQLYDNGEWTFTQPLIYGSNAFDDNTIIAAGQGYMSEAEGQIGYDVGVNGSYVYSAASSGGNLEPADYYGAPPTFVQEMTRSMFYLPGGAGGVPTLILFDRMNVEQPDPNANWYATQWDEVSNWPLKELIFHAPVAPTVNSDSVSWQTAGGQNVNIDMLTPGLTVAYGPESTSVIGGYGDASELTGDIITMTPSTYQQWNTFLDVVQTSEPGASSTNLAVQSTDGLTQGVLVERAGDNDDLVMFNGQQGPNLPADQYNAGGDLVYPSTNILGMLNQDRFHESGFTVDVTTTTAVTNSYFCDLDPGKRWSVTVDGQSVPMTVSAAGIGSFNISGAGAHTIVISVAGTNSLQATMGDPVNGTTVTPASQVSISFNQPLDSGTLNFTVTDSSGNVVVGSTTYYASTDTAVFTPYSPLTETESYSVSATGATSSNGSVMTPLLTSFSVADVSGPAITQVTATATSTTSATLTWTTDLASDSQVQFGTTSTYGQITSLNSSDVTSHQVVLTGLSPDTTYHFQVLSRDLTGKLAASPDFTFTTPALVTGTGTGGGTGSGTGSGGSPPPPPPAPGNLAVTLGATARFLQFIDGSGAPVTINFSGPGSAVVYLGGTNLRTTTLHGKDTVQGDVVELTGIDATGTTSRSALSITVNRGAALNLDEITSNGSLLAIRAPKVTLTGDLSVAGTIGTLTLASAAGGDLSAAALGSVVVSGQFADPIQATSLRTLSVGSITGGTWAIGASVGSVLAKSVSNWDASVGGTLSRLNVTGIVSSSDIRVAGNIGVVQASVLSSSTIFAGVVSSAGAQSLPTSSAELSNSYIGSIALSGGSGSFVDSYIAAGAVHQMHIREVQTNNNGVPFGIAAGEIGSFSAGLLGAKHMLSLVKPTSSEVSAQGLAAKGLTLGDLVLQVIPA